MRFFLKIGFNCALNDLSCRCAIKQYTFIHSQNWENVKLICKLEATFVMYLLTLSHVQMSYHALDVDNFVNNVANVEIAPESS